MRSKNIQLGDVKGYRLDGPPGSALRDVRVRAPQGIQPESTQLRDSQAAIRASERAGVAFNADPA
jgi:hypothetical protein